MAKETRVWIISSKSQLDGHTISCH